MSLITNKIKQNNPVGNNVGDNAKILEEMMKKVNWRYLTIIYFSGLLTLVFSVFLFIVVIRFAFIIF